MIACDTFGRALLFAAVAAVGSIAWVIVAGPVISARGALLLYLAGTTALLLSSLSPRGLRRKAVALIAGGAALVVALVAQTMGEVAVGLAMVLGIGRAMLHPATPARAIAREVLLLGAGLWFAWALAGPSLRGVALALWGFLLAQSLFFLGGGARRRDGAGAGDAFDEARRRAVALMETAP